MNDQIESLSTEASVFVTELMAWFAQALPSFLAGIGILLIGWWVAGRVQKIIDKSLDRMGKVDDTLHSVIATSVRYAILVIVVIAALGQFGLQTTSILAALGAAGLAIGLALQGTLSNIAAGMMLLWLRPFRNGDFIEAGNIAGTVKDIGLFASEIHRWDGIYQFVPNSELWNKQLINYSKMPERLIDLEFSIAYKDDPEGAQNTLKNMAGQDERVLKAPEPLTFVDTLGESSVNIKLRVWVKTADYWPTRRFLMQEGKRKLEEDGFSIPFPHREVIHYRAENQPAV